jgi:hypothetical protein
MRALLIGILSGLVASYTVVQVWPPEIPAEALMVAYDQGKKDALRTNPVSMDLEMVCLSLWAGKQPVAQWEDK